MKRNRGEWALLITMVIFGTVGVAAKMADLPSGVIAVGRGLIGAASVALLALLLKKKMAVGKKDWLYLIASGACIGINWIFLFESYHYTSVAVSTVCYYLAPVFMVVGSVIVYHEKLSVKQVICVLVALIGTAFLSGLKKMENVRELIGMGFAIAAGAFYAAATMINKHPLEADDYGKSVVQLLAGGLTVLPYALIVDRPWNVTYSASAILWVVILGVAHTGIAYSLLFYSVPKVSAQRVALVSYVDPLVAVILSYTVLQEKITWYGIVGSVLVLGAAVAGSVNFKKRTKE